MVSILSRMNLALLVALPAGSAVAAETWLPPLRVGDDNTWVQLYGQLDPGFLVVDDGHSTLGYGPVDNGNASTRFGVRMYVGIASGTYLGANYEAQYDPYSTNYVNQLNRGEPDWDRYLTRKAEAYLNSQQFGVLWVGQGSMASDGTAEVDLVRDGCRRLLVHIRFRGRPALRLFARRRPFGDQRRLRVQQFRRPRPEGSCPLRHADVRRLHPVGLLRHGDDP